MVVTVVVIIIVIIIIAVIGSIVVRLFSNPSISHMSSL